MHARGSQGGWLYMRLEKAAVDGAGGGWRRSSEAIGAVVVGAGGVESQDLLQSRSYPKSPCSGSGGRVAYDP